MRSLTWWLGLIAGHLFGLCAYNLAWDSVLILQWHLPKVPNLDVCFPLLQSKLRRWGLLASAAYLSLPNLSPPVRRA